MFVSWISSFWSSPTMTSTSGLTSSMISPSFAMAAWEALCRSFQTSIVISFSMDASVISSISS